MADRFGNLVSATPSGGWLQSSPVIPELGWPLGTRAQMFWLEPGLPSSLAPGKRPRTTLSPTLALREGEPYLAFGHARRRHAGPVVAPRLPAARRTSARTSRQAIDAPDFHTDHFPSSFYPRQAEPRSLSMEARFGDDVIEELRRRGHDVTVTAPWSLGRVSAAGREHGTLKAAAKPARDAGLRGRAMTAVDHVVSREDVIWAFGPELDPVLEVEPGATVRFETNDCFSGQIRSEDDLVTEIDFERVNSATGPVAVRGAEPGDSLVVDVLEVNPIDWGVATLIPGYGQLIDKVSAPVTRVFKVEDGMVEMNEAGPVPGAPDGRGRRRTRPHPRPDERPRRPARREPGQPHARAGLQDLLPGSAGGRALRRGGHARLDGRRRDCFTGVEIAGEVTMRSTS